MDALRLARGMTYKYAAAGVNLGGGKAVIIGDPRREKTGLIKGMGRFIGSLGGEYQTGEDVGATLDDMETLYGETDHVVTLPEYCGGAGNIGPATAFGVQQAMKACAREVWGSDSLRGRVVAMQGLSNVSVESASSTTAAPSMASARHDVPTSASVVDDRPPAL
jgi:leucine dehydrogenase